jgi:hypothetical protein
VPLRDAATAEESMSDENKNESGRVHPMILLWALGIPLPIIVLILLFRGCA